jgi:hypothetical protein
MRSELARIENIERFLSGDLTQAELTNFQNELNSDPALQAQVEQQRLMQQAIQRTALRSEIEAISGSSGFSFKKVIVTVAVALTVGISLWIGVGLTTNSKDDPTSNTATTALVEQPQQEQFGIGGLRTWVEPEVQKFSLDAGHGGIVEGKDGILIVVPENAFLDQDGNSVTDNVDLELVEALHLTEMVLYNLGTISNDSLLESDGMFYLNASQNGMDVTVNPERPLYIEIPTDEVKPNMMAFTSEADSAGNLNWVNPIPLKKYLTKVDLALLDFLPEGFEEGVQKGMPFAGHRRATDVLVDSLYYSLAYAGLEVENNSSAIAEQVSVFMDDDSSWTSPSITSPNDWGWKVDTATKFSFSARSKSVETAEVCGINPLSIKTIRTRKFQETFVATVPFEARVRALHKLENGQQYLDLYLSNLSMDLYKIDSMVMKKVPRSSRGVFEAFYAQKLTNLKDADIYQQHLSAYYTEKKREYGAAQKALRDELARKQSAELSGLYEEINKTIASYQTQTTVVASATVTPIVAQLPSPSVATANAQSYGVAWSAMGWANIDSYLHLLSKGAEYVEIATNADTTEKVQMYQWLNAINTLTPLIRVGNKGTAAFPKRESIFAKQIQNTYCFAIAEDNGKYRWGQMQYNPYAQASIALSMQATEINEIKAQLDRIGGHSSKVMKHLKAVKQQMKKQKEIQKEQQRLQAELKKKLSKVTAEIKKIEAQRFAIQQFIRSLRIIAFPCDPDGPKPAGH